LHVTNCPQNTSRSDYQPRLVIGRAHRTALKKGFRKGNEKRAGYPDRPKARHR
jgi:hypothetical protein